MLALPSIRASLASPDLEGKPARKPGRVPEPIRAAVLGAHLARNTMLVAGGLNCAEGRAINGIHVDPARCPPPGTGYHRWRPRCALTTLAPKTATPSGRLWPR
jgi:hypothetical protein